MSEEKIIVTDRNGNVLYENNKYPNDSKLGKLDIRNQVNGIVIEQFKTLVERTNDKLLNSLKNMPFGYGEATLCVGSQDMRNSIVDYYRKLGYKVYVNGCDVKIKIEGWYKPNN